MGFRSQISKGFVVDVNGGFAKRDPRLIGRCLLLFVRYPEPQDPGAPVRANVTLDVRWRQREN